MSNPSPSTIPESLQRPRESPKHVAQIDQLPAHLQSLVKTSATHPLNISWILPDFMVSRENPATSSWFLRKYVTEKASKERLHTGDIQKTSFNVASGRRQSDTSTLKHFFQHTFLQTGSGTSKTQSTLGLRTSTSTPVEPISSSELCHPGSMGRVESLIQELKSEFVGVEENGIQRDLIEIGTVEEYKRISPFLNLNAPKSLGNLALCSVPGKKVRLDGNGVSSNRVPFLRSLEDDFKRIASLDLKTSINLLDDQELELLGAPWSSYVDAATQAGVEVLRFPMMEGGCPDDVLDFHQRVVEPLDARLNQGMNVVCHCRGGVGRAGVVACCWLLYRGFCTTPDHAVKFLRLRRSPKAIETRQQMDFLSQYHHFVRYLDNKD